MLEYIYDSISCLYLQQMALEKRLLLPSIYTYPLPSKPQLPYALINDYPIFAPPLDTIVYFIKSILYKEVNYEKTYPAYGLPFGDPSAPCFLRQPDAALGIYLLRMLFW